MSRFAIRPRRWYDRLDAIEDKLLNYLEKGGVIDQGANPNGKQELLQWAFEEITRLREKCGEAKPAKPSKLIPGPRPVATPTPVKLED